MPDSSGGLDKSTSLPDCKRVICRRQALSMYYMLFPNSDVIENERRWNFHFRKRKKFSAKVFN